MLKILQARLQQYVNSELLDVQAGFRKGRDVISLTKVHIVKRVVFPVVMYRSESWTIKKAEHQRIDTFQIVVLEKTLGNLLDCKEIKLVNPKGNQPL